MTRNEKIAEMMGWEVLDREYCLYEFSGRVGFEGIVESSFNLYDWEAVKAMQSKMAADKHMIKIMNNWDGKYMAESVLSCKNSIMSDWCDTEPAAIVDLFCKVYSIEGEG